MNIRILFNLTNPLFIILFYIILNRFQLKYNTQTNYFIDNLTYESIRVLTTQTVITAFMPVFCYNVIFAFSKFLCSLVIHRIIQLYLREIHFLDFILSKSLFYNTKNRPVRYFVTQLFITILLQWKTIII